MATLRDRINASIATQQQELQRIQSTAAEQTAAVRQRLMQLQNASDALTPEIEALLLALAAVGIKVEFKEQ
jgi:hypothetical protein